MRKALLTTFTASLFCFSIAGWGQTNSCDLTGNGIVDSADVQAAINMSLGITPCTANIAGANVCNVIVVQRVVNASQGAGCFTSTGLHVVALTWGASTGATKYQVWRGTTPGGETLLNSSVTTTSYTDNTVVSGTTYYYVVKAVDSSNNVSPSSGEVQAVIPTP
jgi:hypothetical protein